MSLLLPSAQRVRFVTCGQMRLAPSPHSRRSRRRHPSRRRHRPCPPTGRPKSSSESQRTTFAGKLSRACYPAATLRPPLTASCTHQLQQLPANRPGPCQSPCAFLPRPARARSERCFERNRVEVRVNSTWAPLCAPADVGTWTADEGRGINYLLCKQRECCAPCTCRVKWVVVVGSLHVGAAGAQMVQWHELLALLLSSFQAENCSGTAKERDETGVGTNPAPWQVFVLRM
jgi:hypothetical protein